MNRPRSTRISITLLTLGLAAPPLAHVAAAAAGQVPAATEQAKEKKDDKTLPLKPERRIEFTTEEATWLSLDVSPDGRTIVLELLGDLYTLPIGGGEARPLMGGMAFDSQPRYSPDGRWIAFLSDRDGSENLWIARADGTEPKKLSDDPKDSEFASPAWTPDGEYVIVSRSTFGLRTYELWMYHVKGGAGVQITRAKAAPDLPHPLRHNALGAIASPDGRHLYYAVKQGGFQYNAAFPMWQIARRDRITGDEDVLTQSPGSAVRPLLSPDGRLLVYGTRHDTETGLRVRDLVTGGDRWLLYPVQRDDQESRFTRDLLPGYAFLPDGKEIVLTYGGRIHRVDVATGSARPIPFSANVALDLGPRLEFPRRVDEGAVRARLIHDPVLSPDGRRLAFSALARLYVMDLPKGAPRSVLRTGERGFQPVWSPDGRWLAYVTWGAEGGHIWKVRPQPGSRPQRLTTTAAFYSDPVWSPDGARVVALRAPARERLVREFDFGQPSGMDLVWIPAGGGEARLVIPARGAGKPHFTRDPDRIHLYLAGDFFSPKAPHGLVSMRFDGTDRRDHLKVTGPGIYFAEEPVPAEDIRLGPDGRWALAKVGNQVYVLAVPRVGGAAPAVDLAKPGVPLKKLTDVGADYFGWADGGRTVTWAVGATFFRQPFDSIRFEAQKDGGTDGGGADGARPAGGEATGAQPAVKTPPAAEAKKEPSPVVETEVVLEAPRKTPRGTLVLRGATVITMRGEQVVRNADLVVDGNRIADVGPTGTVRVPEGARVLDLRGRTIVPGFVDTHAHWFEIRRGVLDLQNWSFLANLAYGVTAGLDVQTATNDMFAYQDLVDAGEILGPRAFSTGPGVFSDNDFQSLEDVKGVLTRYKKHYRTGNIKSYLVGNRRQRQWVVQASRELEMMPTTEGALSLKLDLTHVIDGFSGNEHSLPIVPLYRDVVETVARSGVGYTPTLLVAYGGPFAENYFYVREEVHDDPKLGRFTPHEVVDAKSRRLQWFRQDEFVHPRTAAQAAKIVRAGGRVGVGGHGQLQGLGYHWEMWALAQGGLSPMEVLRAATLHGAGMIGYGRDLGSLEPGKLADLVVLDSSPLDDIRNTGSIRYVMKNGELFEGATLDQVWPETRPLPPLYWWNDGAPGNAD